MKYVLCIVFMFSFYFQAIAQKNNGTLLVKRFFKEVYNLKTSPETVVSKYIVYGDTAFYRQAVNNIKYLRFPTEEGKDSHFSLLKGNIASGSFSIQSYCSLDSIDKGKFSLLSIDERKNVYKLNFTNTIPVYVLLRNRKVVSFFGYQKLGDDNYTFIVYE
ncbi:MAG: hypothetical protein QM594_00975 [Niabella sp.]